MATLQTVTRPPDWYRPLVLSAAAITLLGVFWFLSRYPQLFGKFAHLGSVLPSMAYSSEAIAVTDQVPWWLQILHRAVNWLNSMKIGMTFGVLLGALLHTALRYYPLRIGKNIYLNAVKGALVGVPMGVCANCAVPAMCGLTRANDRTELALGFLFSSPNFNPVVLAMTFVALPVSMGVAKYAVLLLVIVVAVPVLVAWIERNRPLSALAGDGRVEPAMEPTVLTHAATIGSASRELALDYVRNIWMLLKPTLVLMVLASVLASAALALLPWSTLLSDATPLRLAFVSLVSVFMPVPIALDVMFAAQLQQQGVDASFVMLFAMTLGTYSIIPMIYLWREISKVLAVSLFVLFWFAGWITALFFS